MTEKERRATEDGPIGPTEEEREALQDGDLEKLKIDAGESEVVFE